MKIELGYVMEEGDGEFKRLMAATFVRLLKYTGQAIILSGRITLKVIRGAISLTILIASIIALALSIAA